MAGRFSVSDEWKRWLVGVGMAGLVAYFTTVQTIRGEVADVKKDVAAVKATQESQFGEVLRRLDTLQADIRELRR
jgi:hypothetical protein